MDDRTLSSPPSASRKLLRGSVVTLGFAIAAILFWKLRIIDSATILEGGLIPNTDFFTQLYPMHHRAAAWMRDGTFPLWNPYQFAGHPLLATGIYGIVYPINLFHVLWPTDLAMEMAIVSHLILSGVFMYAFARTIDLSQIASVGAGISFMLSGFMSAMAMWFQPAHGSAVWIPLGFLAVEKIVRTRDARWCGVLAISVAMPILAGWLQNWVYMMYALGGYTAIRLAPMAFPRLQGTRLASASLLVIVGVALGLGVACLQLLPSIELQGLGPRRAGGLNPEQFLDFAEAPSLFLARFVDSAPGLPRPVYLGLASVVVLPLSLLARERGLVLYLWTLGAIGLLLALTIFTPLFWLLIELPFLGLFRVQSVRALFPFAFAGAALFGIALDTCRSLAGGQRGARLRLLAAAGPSAIGLAWLALVPMPALSRAYLLAALCLLWAALFGRRAGLRSAALLGLVVLQGGDLWTANRNPYQHPYHTTETLHAHDEAYRFVREHQGFDRTFIDSPLLDHARMAKQGSLQRIYAITDYEPLSLERFERFFAFLEPPWEKRGENVPFYGQLRLFPYMRQFSRIDVMSVRFIVTQVQQVSRSLGRLGWNEVFRQESGGVRVLENPRPLPRAYVAHCSRIVADQEEALETLGRVPDFDPHRSVVLEAGTGTSSPSAECPPATPARIDVYQPDLVEITSDASLPGHLVLTDTHYPGWEAEVDGEPREILRANSVVRAIRIDEGHHVVRFRYKPASVRIGAILSLVALLGIAGCFVTSRNAWLRWR